MLRARFALPLALLLVECSKPSTSSQPTIPSDTPPAVSSPDAGDPDQAKSPQPRASADTIAPAALRDAVAANNAFALDLYAHLRANPSIGSGNLVTSPLSAWLALTMTYAGAKGATASEMAKALHLGASPFDGQNALSQALASRVPSSNDSQLQIVNSVWGERSYPWEQPFLDVLAKSYGAGVELADFIHQSDAARVAINTWVSAHTADTIKDLFPAGTIDDTTRMVLVNAIHLKVPWLTPFVASKTTQAPFTKRDGSKVTASFLHDVRSVGYVDDGKAQIASLALQGSELAVVVALPRGDLATYEKGLTAESLVGHLQSAEVDLALPKLSFTSQPFSLKAALQAMGMVQAFDGGRADFSGACAKTPDGQRLYVTQVLQKTMVAIAEPGIEAAAATGVSITATAARLPTVQMTVDRPFVLAIVDSTTGAILFVGHIDDPTQGG